MHSIVLICYLENKTRFQNTNNVNVKLNTMCDLVHCKHSRGIFSEQDEFLSESLCMQRGHSCSHATLI